MSKTLYIRASAKRVPVSEETYLAYYRSKRRDRYFERDIKIETPIRDKDGNVIGYRPAKEDSLDRLMAAGEQFAAVQKSVEATVLDRIGAEDLHKALDKLPESERELIDALFFQGMTEREAAAIFGLSQKGINKRKARVLAVLAKFLES